MLYQIIHHVIIVGYIHIISNILSDSRQNKGPEYEFLVQKSIHQSNSRKYIEMKHTYCKIANIYINKLILENNKY